MILNTFVFCLLLAASSIHAQTCSLGAMQFSTTELTGNYLAYSFNNVLQEGTTGLSIENNIVVGEDKTFFLTIGISGTVDDSNSVVGCYLTTEGSYTNTFKWNGTVNWKGETVTPNAYLTVGPKVTSYCLFNFGGDIASISFRANTDDVYKGKIQFLTSDKTEVGCKIITNQASATINDYSVHSFKFTGGSDGKQFPKYMNVTNYGWALDNMRIVMSAGVVNEPTQEEPVAAPVKKSSASFTSTVALVASIAVGLVVALL